MKKQSEKEVRRLTVLMPINTFQKLEKEIEIFYEKHGVYVSMSEFASKAMDVGLNEIAKKRN